MRKFFEEGKLITEVIQAIMSEEKPNQKEKITLSMDRVEKFIPKSIKISQREDFICKALEHYNKETEVAQTKRKSAPKQTVHKQPKSKQKKSKER